ncbi:MAG: hypothetical protein Ct9H90mP13_13900 [Pseudomonadota bacterium]|nr:MAG: hypothetical protein Ct9H90mP13_13900 [Pseudomonadota bacterium]
MYHELFYLEGFEKAMERQRELARRASKFQSDDSFSLNHDLKSEFHGYKVLETDSKIIGIFGEDGSDSPLSRRIRASIF